MSSYFNLLSYIAQKHYLTKLNIDGCMLQDPYTIEESLWSEDMSKWPDLQFGDIYTYFVDTEGCYTKEKLKALKKLHAYLLPCNIKTRCNRYLRQLKAVVGWKLLNGDTRVCLITPGSSINHKQNLSQQQLITDHWQFQLPVILYHSLHYWAKSNNDNLCINAWTFLPQHIYCEHTSLGK